jgi:hypothetical protein
MVSMHIRKMFAESRCRVCHRPLTATTSVIKGIGPVCDRKIIATRAENHVLPKGAREENAHPTLDDYLAQCTQPIRCTCYTRLYRDDLVHYAHAGGLPVRGYKERQWIYFHCPYCNNGRKIQVCLRRGEA